MGEMIYRNMSYTDHSLHCLHLLWSTQSLVFHRICKAVIGYNLHSAPFTCVHKAHCNPYSCKQGFRSQLVFLISQVHWPSKHCFTFGAYFSSSRLLAWANIKLIAKNFKFVVDIFANCDCCNYHSWWLCVNNDCLWLCVMKELSVMCSLYSGFQTYFFLPQWYSISVTINYRCLYCFFFFFFVSPD